MKPPPRRSTRSACFVPSRSSRHAPPSTRSSPGQILEVLADDRAAEEDLTRFAKRAGHEMVAIEDEGDYKRFLIRRGE